MKNNFLIIPGEQAKTGGLGKSAISTNMILPGFSIQVAPTAIPKGLSSPIL